MSQRLLITGGAGFIGSHLVDAALSREWEVAVVDNFDPFYARTLKERNLAIADRPRWVYDIDLTDAVALVSAFDDFRPDAVVHLAARAGVRPSLRDPAGYAMTNVVGTQRVLDACLAYGVNRAVVASSSSVYGNNAKVPFSETDDVSRPISPYAATKVATELLCRAATELHSMPITTLRFFTVYGPRQRPDLAIRLFMSRIAAGESITMFGDGTMSRDFTFIDDIIGGVLSALDRCGDVERYRCYNLGSDRPIELRNLISAIESTVGRSATVALAPEQPGDVQRTWADLRRSKHELNYEPVTPLEDGLRKQWDWLQTIEPDLR
ncbi:MAG: NAD-dependent epimerase/dehydratase family protein [Phycisphaerales bacterium]